MNKPSYTPDEIAAAMALAHDPRTAAATDMYKALTEVADLVDGMEDIDNEGGPNLAMRIQTAIRAAIAKAEGRK